MSSCAPLQSFWKLEGLGEICTLTGGLSPLCPCWIKVENCSWLPEGTCGQFTSSATVSRPSLEVRSAHFTLLPGSWSKETLVNPASGWRQFSHQAISREGTGAQREDLVVLLSPCPTPPAKAQPLGCLALPQGCFWPFPEGPGRHPLAPFKADDSHLSACRTPERGRKPRVSEEPGGFAF